MKARLNHIRSHQTALLRGLVIFAIALGLHSCGDRFEEINVNPNQPTTTNPDFLWTEAVAVGAGQFSTGVHTEIWTLMEWTMMMGDLNGYPVGGNPYAYSGDWNDELWVEWYSRLLAPTNEIIRLTESDLFLVNKHSIARIWRAWAFHRITDLWGDVPYTEALRGAAAGDNAVLTPSYDAQSAIYTDLLNELKEAAQALDPSKASFGGADPIYAGDVELWRKFANTLRLRLALRISKADPSTAQSHAMDLISDGNLISSNAEGAHFVFAAQALGPFYELENTGQGMRNPSHFLIEALKASNDPRLEIYAEFTPESLIFGNPDHVGVPNLFTTADLSAFNDFNTSAVGGYFLALSTPGTTISYAESCFLQAEAALLGFGGNAQQHYENGVRAHMEYLNVPSGDIDDFLAAGGSYDGSLEQIIGQKYLTFVYKDGFEAFAEYRRTGFPVLRDLNGDPIDASTVPQRIPYPPNEISLNGTHVSEVGEGINDFSSPVWWAK